MLRAIRRPNASGCAERRCRTGSDGHRVGATDTGGEGGDGGAEHVHPRVVLAHHRPAGHDVLPLVGHRAAPETRGPAPTGGGQRAAWRWSGTARRSRRSGTPGGEAASSTEARRGEHTEVVRSPAAIDQPSSCASEAPRSCTGVAIDNDAEDAGVAGQPARPATQRRSGRAVLRRCGRTLGGDRVGERLGTAPACRRTARGPRARLGHLRRWAASRTTGARSSSTPVEQDGQVESSAEA